MAKFLPTGLLTAGAAATLLVGSPHPTPLVRPLDATLPASFLGHPAVEVPIGEDERRVSGVSDLLNRAYDVGDSAAVFLYVGYHATQQGDNRMHSPSLCLPGSGWTPVGSSLTTVPVAGAGRAAVNRFVLQKGASKILVYYWFQGRGRVTAGEAQLKLNAFKDSFLHHRDEEALVRIIVPLVGSGRDRTVGATGLSPDAVATRLASAVIPDLQTALPPAP